MRKAAVEFAKKWSSQKTEKQLAQSFWMDFFHNVIGVPDTLFAGIDFEHPVRVENPQTGVTTTKFIDVLWGGIVLIEHKSAGKSLDEAEQQARRYLTALDAKLRTPFIFVSDFATIRIVDVLGGTSYEFQVKELSKNIDRLSDVFGGYRKNATRHEIAADRKAGEKMARLYKAFEEEGHTGHETSVFLIRLLFLLFGDDTQMWKQPQAFEKLVLAQQEDGSTLGFILAGLFRHLDTPVEERAKNSPEYLSPFPYVNGGLFREDLGTFYFSQEMRDALVDACSYDWSAISPAIFGAMFQTVKSKEERRTLGEHYTSETNILKVIRPLFLDDYLERMRKSWDSPRDLRRLLADLGSKHYLDPACGSGNFLIVAYKRLRDIELKIHARLRDLAGAEGQVGLPETAQLALSVSMEQFHGIEFEDWSSQIATVAMFLADRQANIEMEEVLGTSPDRFPLTETAHIVHGDALKVPWADVCTMDDDTIIMGNPPFYGSTDLEPWQKEDVLRVWGNAKGAAELDYVASWFLLAAKNLATTRGKAAFVSTSSITQGQQPPIIWNDLYQLGFGIDFAHRAFVWRNEGGSLAGVHCVIVGISENPKPAKRSLWVYPASSPDAELVLVSNINAYLLDAPNVLVRSKSRPIQDDTQPARSGDKPVDGGFLSKISAEEAEIIRSTDPIAAKYLRRVVGSQELINNIERYGLWLKDAPINDLASSPVLKARVDAVRELRLASTKATTKEDANRAWEWQETTKTPKGSFLAIPLASSENRDYTPMAILDSEWMPNNLLAFVDDASLLTFGVMMSSAFAVWNKGVSGRIRNDPRVSLEVTYNNFPFPDDLSEAARKKIEVASQAVIDARGEHPDASLATLYSRTLMPTSLRQAHVALDKAVLNAYGLQANATEAGILEHLISRYTRITAGLLAAVTPTTKRRR